MPYTTVVVVFCAVNYSGENFWKPRDLKNNNDKVHWGKKKSKSLFKLEVDHYNTFRTM